MTTEEREQFSEDLIRWISSGPSDEDVLDYAKRTPDSSAELLLEVGDAVLTKLTQRKNIYFHRLNFPDFCDKLTEAQQLTYIHYLTAFEQQSIIQSIHQASPTLQIPANLPPLKEWAEKYTSAWRAMITLVTAKEFFTQQLYAKSLFTKGFTPPQAAENMELFKRYLLRSSHAFENGDVIEQKDLDQERSTLMTLGIFPVAALDGFFEFDRIHERLIIYFQLYCIFTVYTALLKENTALDSPMLEASLRELLENNMEHDLLQQAEGGKLASSEHFAGLKQFYDYLNRLWIPAHLADGTTVSGELQKYLSSVPTDGVASYLNYLTDFLSTSAVVEVILEPLDAYPTVRKIIESASSGEVENFRQLLVDQVAEEKKPLAAALIQNIQSIYQHFSYHA